MKPNPDLTVNIICAFSSLGVFRNSSRLCVVGHSAYKNVFWTFHMKVFVIVISLQCLYCPSFCICIKTMLFHIPMLFIKETSFSLKHHLSPAFYAFCMSVGWSINTKNKHHFEPNYSFIYCFIYWNCCSCWIQSCCMTIFTF